MSERKEGPGWDRALDAAEALLWIGLLVFGGLVAQAMLQDPQQAAVQATRRADVVAPAAPAAPAAPVGLVEAEDLEVLARSRPAKKCRLPQLSGRLTGHPAGGQ